MVWTVSPSDEVVTFLEEELLELLEDEVFLEELEEEEEELELEVLLLDEEEDSALTFLSDSSTFFSSS